MNIKTYVILFFLVLCTYKSFAQATHKNFDEVNEEYFNEKEICRISNRSFPIVIIIDGELSCCIELYPYIDGERMKLNVLNNNYGDIIVDSSSYSKLISADSIKVSALTFVDKGDFGYSDQLEFTIHKGFFGIMGGPVVYVYTIDDKKNRIRFKNFSKKFKRDYFAYEIIIKYGIANNGQFYARKR